MPNELVIRVQPDESIAIKLVTKHPGTFLALFLYSLYSPLSFHSLIFSLFTPSYLFTPSFSKPFVANFQAGLTEDIVESEIDLSYKSKFSQITIPDAYPTSNFIFLYFYFYFIFLYFYL
jgi:hypothetical protein